MSTYVVLLNLTEESADGLPDGHADLTQALSEEADRQGGKLQTLLWTAGEFDGVAIIDLPDDRRAAAVALGLAKEGLRTKTLTAFDDGAMGEIAGHLRGGHLRGGHLRGGHLRGGHLRGGSAGGD